MPRDLVKDVIRKKLRQAVRSGRVAKPSACSECKMAVPRGRLHGHHWNGYDKPFDIQWLCINCHAKHLSKEQNGHAKLTVAKVQVMRLMKQNGASFSNIAFMFGVCKKTAWEAITGITWASVPSPPKVQLLEKK